MFKLLDENLFVFEDTCQVYILRYKNKAVVINVGTGSFISKLNKIGVTQLERVLLTDHHYGHSMGLTNCKFSEVEAFASQDETLLLKGASDFWQKKRVFLNYDLGTYFPPPRNVKKVSELTE